MKISFTPITMKSTTKSLVTKIITNVLPSHFDDFDKRLMRESLLRYDFAIKNKTGITQKKVNELLKLDREKFLRASYDFICSGLGINDCLKPKINILEQENYNTPLGYLTYSNTINVFKNTLDLPKCEIYSQIRHEIQHFLQNMDILRSDELSNIAIERYADSLKGILNYYAHNSNLEEAQINCDDKAYDLIFQLKEYLSKNDKNTYDKTIESAREAYKEKLQTISNLAKKNIGILNKDTAPWYKAVTYFNEFMTPYKYNQDKTLNQESYVSLLTELEAFTVQDKALLEFYDKPICFYKFIQYRINKFELRI